jgi:oligopeptide transport system ATP-binding protein
LKVVIGLAIIWITHDLGVVAGIADRVIVMYAGQIVEEAAVQDLFSKTRHPYTEGLIGSLPRLDERTQHRLDSIDGLPPDLIDLPPGCPFYARCKYRIDKCRDENPPLEKVGVGHVAACWVDINVAQATTEDPWNEK